MGYRQVKLNLVHPATTYDVVNVLDGDTFVIEDYHQRIRLYGVEAPDLKYPYGEESKKFLESLIMDKKVYFKNIIADRYGRIVALAYLDDLLINQAVIRQGYAEHDGHVIASEPNLLSGAEMLAKQEQLGIFGPGIIETENSDNPQCSIKANIRRGIKTYLFPGCKNYEKTIVEKHKGDRWFCTEAEAKKAGFIYPKGCYGKSFPVNK